MAKKIRTFKFIMPFHGLDDTFTVVLHKHVKFLKLEGQVSFVTGL